MISSLQEMAGGNDAQLEAQMKGLSKHFNSYTLRGRANVSKATIRWRREAVLVKGCDYMFCFAVISFAGGEGYVRRRWGLDPSFLSEAKEEDGLRWREGKKAFELWSFR